MGEHDVLFNGRFYYSDDGVFHDISLEPIDCRSTYDQSIDADVNGYKTIMPITYNTDINGCRTIMPATSITIKSNDLTACSNTDCADIHSIIQSMCNKYSIGNTDEDNKEEEAMDLHPVKIIFNDPVSVVFWEDGEKTVVRRHEGEPYDKYTAFCAALAIKIFGSNTEVNRIVRNGIDQQEKDRKKAEKYKKQITNSIRKVVKSKEL